MAEEGPGEMQNMRIQTGKDLWERIGKAKWDAGTHPLQKHKEVVDGKEYKGPAVIGKAK